MKNYEVALAELEYPTKALNNLTIDVCLKQVDHIPRKLYPLIQSETYALVTRDRRLARNSMCVPIPLLDHRLQTA